ncbi:MAG: hypothetical protein FVQ81_12205 [Candidatus Glassbacteria bacterium]|nr:hypothetical protein [Candidatus Glassbacteria bacterium]
MSGVVKIPKKVEKEIRRVAVDNTHGATWLSKRSLEVLADAAQVRGIPSGGEKLAAYLRAVTLKLRAAQPTMSSLSNHLVRALARMPGIGGDKPGMSGLDKPAVLEAVKDELDSQQQELMELGDYGAKLLAEKFPGKARLITISASNGVFEILRRLEGGSDLVITVAESRPMREGVQFARKLAGLGFEVRLVTDAMLGIETVGADCVLTGADTVQSDGSLINKAGTRLLALAAKMDKVPFFCCTQTIKVSPVTDKTGPMIPDQRIRDPEEIQRDATKGITIENIYFDRTEYFLISGYISEIGFLRVKEIAEICDKLARREKRVLGSTGRES